MHKKKSIEFGEVQIPQAFYNIFSRDYARKGQENKKALKNQGFSRLYLFYVPYLVAEMVFEINELKLLKVF